jgi:hypothetical protein
MTKILRETDGTFSGGADFFVKENLTRKSTIPLDKRIPSIQQRVAYWLGSVDGRNGTLREYLAHIIMEGNFIDSIVPEMISSNVLSATIVYHKFPELLKAYQEIDSEIAMEDYLNENHLGKGGEDKSTQSK